MDPPAPHLPLLEGDPARQAADAIRGFRYQIWRSVEAWIGLKDDHLLALEAAEDFDVLGHALATANQVKDVARPMTLRSPEVLKAIASFWDLRERNPGRPIRFRFLTTASAGIERGTPFGPGTPGLDTWRRAAQSDARIDQLRSFLIEQELPPSLILFLKTTTDAEIREKLLQPIEWALDQGPAEEVEEAVKEKLVLLGNEQLATPDEAVKVAAHLFAAAFAAASRKTRRPLRRSDLLTLFRQTTAQAFNRGEALALARAHRLVPDTVAAGTPSSGRTASSHYYSVRARSFVILLATFVFAFAIASLFLDPLLHHPKGSSGEHQGGSDGARGNTDATAHQFPPSSEHGQGTTAGKSAGQGSDAAPERAGAERPGGGGSPGEPGKSKEPPSSVIVKRYNSAWTWLCSAVKEADPVRAIQLFPGAKARKSRRDDIAGVVADRWLADTAGWHLEAGHQTDESAKVTWYYWSVKSARQIFKSFYSASAMLGSFGTVEVLAPGSYFKTTLIEHTGQTREVWVTVPPDREQEILIQLSKEGSLDGTEFEVFCGAIMYDLKPFKTR
ncbi:MAG TPA: hypothetical protein VHQ90_23530 [Thermoanaerobaculia bacterium]|nr:hypothetical protein [Thermoanaerobaculia bacterium]